MGAVCEAYAYFVGDFEEDVGGLGGEEGLIDAVLVYVLVPGAFEGDEGTGSAESDEPMLVEGELVGLAPELVEVVGVPVGIFADHLGEAFFAAAVGDGAAVAVGGSAASGAGYRGTTMA